jgi:hypothetical protein
LVRSAASSSISVTTVVVGENGVVVTAVVADAVALSSGKRSASIPATTINATTAPPMTQVIREPGIVRPSSLRRLSASS